MLGVDFVIHVASPFHLQATDFVKEYYTTAIEGTKEMLLAASRSETVKRVVVTSSVGALMSPEKSSPLTSLD
jgi:nucleoside-diphosphate-sugar epimerase